MVKFVVHLADIHIRTYKHHDEYKAVFLDLFAKVVALTEGYKREEIRIVIAGDLVHQKIVVSNELLIFGLWFLKKLEEIAPVVLIAGNHDLLENNKDRMDSITPLVQFLGNKEVSYFTKSRCYEDDNIIWCVYSIFEENSRPPIDEARAKFGADKTYIGLFHAPLVGAKTDMGFEMSHGTELDVFEGCDIVMLGDIHARQTFNHKGVILAYPSSLVQQNFGENVSKHGFLLWDVANKTFTEHDVENRNSFYHFEISSIEDLENNDERLKNK